MRRHLAALALLMPLSLLAACGNPGDDDTSAPTPSAKASDQDAAAAARDTWEAADVASYTWRYTALCFCPIEEFTVTVVDGEVTQARQRITTMYGEEGKSQRVTPGEERFATVDDLFDFIQSNESESSNARFDDVRGYPTSFERDPNIDTADDEVTITVAWVRPTRS